MRAHRLKRLHARLHVVAVARHATDEARQTERVELRAGQIRRFAEQRLTHIVRHAVRVVNSTAVGRDVQLTRGEGRGDHQAAPEKNEPDALKRNNVIDEMGEDVRNGQLSDRSEELMKIDTKMPCE